MRESNILNSDNSYTQSSGSPEAVFHPKQYKKAHNIITTKSSSSSLSKECNFPMIITLTIDVCLKIFYVLSVFIQDLEV